MDKLLMVVQSVMPLVAFYPRWAQMLFLAAFTSVLGSVFVFVLLFSSASKQKADADSALQLPDQLRRQIDADLASASTAFADLGLALSNYYASAMALRLRVLDHTTAHPDVALYIDDPLTPPLREAAEDVIRTLEALHSAVSSIQRTEFAAACWRRGAASSAVTSLRRVRDRLVAFGFSEREATLDVTDIPNVAQFVAVAVARLRPLTFAPLLTAVLSTNSADIEGVGQQYDDAGLRSLVFAGNLLFGFVDRSRQDPTRQFVASFGSAMLADMAHIMPDSTTIKAELGSRNPQYVRAIDAVRISIEPANLISGDFRLAVAALQKRPGLLFLELPIN